MALDVLHNNVHKHWPSQGGSTPPRDFSVLHVYWTPTNPEKIFWLRYWSINLHHIALSVHSCFLPRWTAMKNKNVSYGTAAKAQYLKKTLCLTHARSLSAPRAVIPWVASYLEKCACMIRSCLLSCVKRGLGLSLPFAIIILFFFCCWHIRRRRLLSPEIEHTTWFLPREPCVLVTMVASVCEQSVPRFQKGNAHLNNFLISWTERALFVNYVKWWHVFETRHLGPLYVYCAAHSRFSFSSE